LRERNCSSSMKILYKFLTRGKPVIFFETLSLYYGLMSNRNDFEVMVPLDANDLTMNNPSMINFLSGVPDLTYSFTPNLGKIEALDLGLKEAAWDILVPVLDDMIPQVQDFDDIIVQNMTRFFPDLDGVLHFNDGFRRRPDLITIQILGRKMFDYLGHLFHSDYSEYWCDKEFTDRVYASGKVKYFPQVIIKHCHKRNGVDTRKHPDHEVYRRRKALNYPV
jgi:hypothetical protein